MRAAPAGGPWSRALAAASSLAPRVVWRRRLAAAVKEAAGALVTSVATCPPGFWMRLEHDTLPERFGHVIDRIKLDFVPQIDRAGEGWRFAVERHGAVYAPLETAEHQALAGAIRSQVLAPAGIQGWIVAFMLSTTGLLLGFFVVGTVEPSEVVLPLLTGPLGELARTAAATLETSMDLAQACGVIVPELDEELPTLTARERQIANYTAQGYSNLNVGALLGISASTVGVHLRRIYRKLGVRSRVELVAALERRSE
jgi:DNA-binding CsgD family transcriptional regulator